MTLADKLREIAELLDYIPAEEVSRGVLATLGTEVKRLLALADYADGRVLSSPYRSSYDTCSIPSRRVAFVSVSPVTRAATGRDHNSATKRLQRKLDKYDGRVLTE